MVLKHLIWNYIKIKNIFTQIFKLNGYISKILKLIFYQIETEKMHSIQCNSILKIPKQFDTSIWAFLMISSTSTPSSIVNT